MQSEQPSGLMWRLRSRPLLCAAVIPVVSLVVTALVAAWVLLPILPPDVRAAFENTHQQVRNPQIPLADQVVLEDELRRLAIATKEGTITPDRCKQALAEIHATIVNHMLTEGLVSRYIGMSTLAEHDASAATNTLRRYALAFTTGKVDEQTALDIQSLAQHTGAEGKGTFHATLTDEQLRGLLEAMDAAADAGDVAEQVDAVDLCPRVHRMVDKTLSTP